MKASIITLHASNNYGSCLQSWATQRLLDSLGVQSEIVDYCRPNSRPKALAAAYFDRAPLNRLGFLWKVSFIKSLAMALLLRRVADQAAPFDRFRRTMLKTSQRYDDIEELTVNPPDADIYITGSDQVWNSIWNGGFDPVFYLQYAPEGKPRIAYAASIGRESIDEAERYQIAEALFKYDAVSMREESGVRIVHNLGKLDAVQVLDPTLMMRRSDWESIATIPDDLPEAYLLTYQLGRSDRFFSFAEKVAKQLNLPIVALCHAPGVRHEGAVNYVSPEVTDFLGLFLKATYVVTDSFHATAFSLNLNIPFSVVPPDRFVTRIESILALTGTSNRLVEDCVDSTDALDPIDFERVNASLEQERKASLDFLSKALSCKADSLVEAAYR